MLIYHGEASQGPTATHVNNSIISKFKTPMLSAPGPQQFTLQCSLERERVESDREEKSGREEREERRRERERGEEKAREEEE